MPILQWCVCVCVLAFRSYQTSEQVMARNTEDQAKGLETLQLEVSFGGNKRLQTRRVFRFLNRPLCLNVVSLTSSDRLIPGSKSVPTDFKLMPAKLILQMPQLQLYSPELPREENKKELNTSCFCSLCLKMPSCDISVSFLAASQESFASY